MKRMTFNRKNRRRRAAVAPVLATLLMVAVAVAMSVIIFTWSQGFLSNTSGATGSQQGAQNQAAQSSINIEIATFDVSQATDDTVTPKIEVTVRNVGSVAVTLGTVNIQGISANAGFKGNLLYSWRTAVSVDVTESQGTWTIDNTHDTSAETTIGKGASVTFTLTETGVACGSAATCSTKILSGDVINIKVTTSVGTFGTAQFVVP